MTNIKKRIIASAIAAASMLAVIAAPVRYSTPENTGSYISAYAAGDITIDDLPPEYQFAADWIWNNRITVENSTQRRNTVFDQIIAGNGTINYVVKWQSYKNVTLEQRKQFEVMLSDCINAWNDCLKGYENWPYEHIDVKIVGWAVIDKNCLIDLQDDEIVYTDTIPYDSTHDTSNGVEEIPNLEPLAPDSISRFAHFADPGYEYPGGSDKRFDMYMWATQGFPSIGGCGGDWGQRLSDDAYINMLDGSNLHVLEHEIGHGFGMPDFYGGEGESNGFPPGGFPGGENSIMMAGSSAKITDFDCWMLRYMWTKIKDEDGRFNILTDIEPETDPVPTEPVTDPISTEPSFILDENEALAEFTYSDSVWKFDAAGADSVTMIFRTESGYTANGKAQFGNLSQSWNGTADESGLLFAEVENLPDGIGEIIVPDTYDSKMTLENVILTYDKEEPTQPETAAPTEPEPTEGDSNTDRAIYGDADDSGEVNLADAVVIVSYIANPQLYPMNEKQLDLADVANRGDGINADDAINVQKHLLGEITELPASYMIT